MAARQISLTLPVRGIFTGVFEGLNEIIELGRLADDSAAFDGLWVSDGLLAVPHPESISVLAALSTVTERVALGVACLGSMAVRDPILLATQLATVDQLSGGRVVITACMGINKRDAKSAREGALYGIADEDRAGRVEETIALLRRLWTEDVVSFEGRYLRVTDVRALPKPVQTPIPLYLAADPVLGQSAERRLRRVARLGDGWLTTRKSGTAMADNWQILSGYLRDEGREPTSFPVVAWHNVNLNPDSEAALEESGRFCEAYHGVMFGEEGLRLMTAIGPVDAVVDHLNGVFDEGANHVMLRLTTWDWRGQLRVLIDDVVPALRASVVPVP
jgi:alkanesulfonate monooxygenase SsuD/methylene tetrahydromethanopterin reductase-like flavin-dependent oxidoreductase (luciferase family)